MPGRGIRGLFLGTHGHRHGLECQTLFPVEFHGLLWKKEHNTSDYRTNVSKTPPAISNVFVALASRYCWLVLGTSSSALQTTMVDAELAVLAFLLCVVSFDSRSEKRIPSSPLSSFLPEEVVVELLAEGGALTCAVVVAAAGFVVSFDS